jgi:hypothetical protein
MVIRRINKGEDVVKATTVKKAPAKQAVVKAAPKKK